MSPAKTTTNSKKFGFLERVKKSFKGPDAYEAQKNRNFWGVAGDLLLFTTLGTCVMFASLAIAFHTFWPNVEAKLNDVSAWYPTDLTLTVRDGIATANQMLTLDLAQFIDDSKIPETIEPESSFNLIIDTETPFAITQLNEYGPSIWVSKEALAVYTPEGEIRQYPWKDMGNFDLNEEVVQVVASKGSEVIERIAYVGIAFLAIAAALLVTIWRLVYLLIFALAVQLIAYLMGAVYPNYNEAYKMGGLAFIPAIIITTLTQATAIWTGFAGFTFYFSLISAIFIAINLKREKA